MNIIKLRYICSCCCHRHSPVDRACCLYPTLLMLQNVGQRKAVARPTRLMSQAVICVVGQE